MQCALLLTAPGAVASHLVDGSSQAARLQKYPARHSVAITASARAPMSEELGEEYQDVIASAGTIPVYLTPESPELNPVSCAFLLCVSLRSGLC